MSLMTRIKHLLARRQGWDPARYDEYKARLRKDMGYRYTTAKEKKWAHARGFSSDRIERYGLTDDNWHEFISDREFAWGFPYNDFSYSRWIDDKLTLYYALWPFREFLPEYYYLVSNDGRCFRLFDAEGQGDAQPEDILADLVQKRHLAVKLYAGSEGVGFYHLMYIPEDGSYWINGEVSPRQAVIDFLKGLRGYLITEYLMPCEELAAIYPNTANSLRIVAIDLPGIEDPITRGLVRFGCKESKEVDNTSQGSIFCLIDVKTGRFETGQRDVEGRREFLQQHPDTGAVFSGVIPHWEEIRKLIKDVCDFMPELELLGFDIVVSTKGLKIMEINSLPEHGDYQLDGPLKADPNYAKLWARTLERKGRMAPKKDPF